jgi:uncharacterized protein (DUF433 family)
MTPLAFEHLTAIERSPDVLRGAWHFRGTRIPVVALFENLRDGATIADFLNWFPGVSEAQVKEVLDYVTQSLEESIHQ